MQVGAFRDFVTTQSDSDSEETGSSRRNDRRSPSQRYGEGSLQTPNEVNCSCVEASIESPITTDNLLGIRVGICLRLATGNLLRIAGSVRF